MRYERPTAYIFWHVFSNVLHPLCRNIRTHYRLRIAENRHNLTAA
jgi:hypothetical protein